MYTYIYAHTLAHTRIHTYIQDPSCLFLTRMHACYLVGKIMLLETLGHCNTLQNIATQHNTATHCSTLCNILQYTAIYYNTLRHTATHCNTLQHTATHCKTLGYLLRICSDRIHLSLQNGCFVFEIVFVLLQNVDLGSRLL